MLGERAKKLKTFFSPIVEKSRGVDFKKRTVMTHRYRFGYYMTDVYFLSLLLATSWPKLSFAITDCFHLSRYVSLVNN